MNILTGPVFGLCIGASSPVIPPAVLTTTSLSAALCRLLLELLELLFDKFNAVAAAHSVVLAHLQQIVVSPNGAQEGIKLYEQADVSAKIQTVLQVSSSLKCQVLNPSQSRIPAPHKHTNKKYQPRSICRSVYP